MVKTLDTQQILLKIEEVLAEKKETNRLIDSINKYLELIYKDRELINESNANVSGLRAEVLQHTQHQENIKDDTNFRLEEVKDKVVGKIDEIKETIDNKKVIKVKNRGFFDFARR